MTLLSGKGHTVGTLIHGGIALVGAYLDLVQRTIVFQIAMVGALLDSTFNRLVCLCVHTP